MNKIRTFQWYFSENQSIPKIYMGSQISSNSQSNIRKDKKAGSITFPDFRLYYINQSSMGLTDIHQWNIIKAQKLTHTYIIYDIGRTIGELTASSISGVRKTGQIQAKINSKWIKTSI